MKLNNIITFIFILFPCLGWGQTMASFGPTVPEGYYIFPIRPGDQNFLSGTMGELRSNHFHAGIDIKTLGVEGLEVYASSSGYISRIKVSSDGYGNAMYILHSNGTTTVYAHLQKFNPAIAEFVREAQYKKKSFEIELYPEKEQFSFEKGELIGYSGNSGSSSGAHLHFEIRDSQQRPLNPLEQKFSEIRDNIAPEVRKIAFRTMDKNSRINDQYGRFEFRVIKKGTNYTLPVPITAYGNIGIEILTHDKLNGANNRNGVPCIEMNVDGNQVFQQNLDRFRFSETRSILIHTDYKTAREQGQRFVKMYVDNGNDLPFYQTNDSKGIIKITKDSTHKVRMSLWDIYNNNAQVVFDIKGTDPANKLTLTNYKGPSKISYDLMNNNLIVKAPTINQEIPCAYIYSNRMRYQLDHAYSVNQTAVFLWDMDQGLPDSLLYDDKKITFDYKALIPGETSFNYYGERLELHVPGKALFDTVFLTSNYKVDSIPQKEQFTICQDIYPIRKNINITLKPTLDYPDPERTAVYALDKRGNPSYKGGSWEGKKINFKTRNWGTFTLLADTVTPEIKPLILNSDRIVFRIKDSLSGIKEYELEMDGDWILMKYDYKKNLIRSEKLDSKKPFKGALHLMVTDNAGNMKKYSTHL